MTFGLVCVRLFGSVSSLERGLELEGRKEGGRTVHRLGIALMMKYADRK